MNTFSPTFLNQILLGDCVVRMQELPDESIPLTVTSPPYDKIRNYGGHPFDFEAVAKELWRVTAQGGVVVWVVADQVNAKGSLTGTKHKQLLYFLSLGFSLLNELTLTTVNTRLPQQIRYAQSSHTAFVLSKGRPRVVNLLRDKKNISAGQFKKDWSARSEDGTMRRGHYGKHIAPFGLRSDVWTYQVGGGHTTRDEINHPDPMAEKMAEDLILSFSRPGDLVFDPMAGSGTTCKLALLNHRSYLGIEIHEPYWAEAVERLKDAQEEYKKRLDDEFSPKIVVPPHHNGHSFEVPSIVIPSKAAATIRHGDVLEVLKGLDSNSFDGVFCDSPYALTRKRGSKRGFLNKKWDGSLPSVEVWEELLRVCKPGAMLLSFGHPRTEHRLKVNVEDAGWIIRDTMMWLNVTGLPKSQDISKAIDRVLGATRKKVRYPRSGQNGYHEADGPIPVTSEAARWLGYGTGLKPAYEPIIVAQKRHEGSYGRNALKWGVAGLNINGSRVNGRFPANIILDEEAGRLLDLQGPTSNGGKYRKSGQRDLRHKGNSLYGGGIGGGKQNAPDTYGDTGGISRFFYCPKATTQERNAGLEGLPIKRPDDRPETAMGMWDKHGIQPQQNHHPAVKPIDLCRHLAALILPPERDTSRKLIVPYAGVASEIIGAAHAGWDEVLGIEIDPEYVEIAQRRIAHWIGKGVSHA